MKLTCGKCLKELPPNLTQDNCPHCGAPLVADEIAELAAILALADIAWKETEHIEDTVERDAQFQKLAEEYVVEWRRRKIQ